MTRSTYGQAEAPLEAEIRRAVAELVERSPRPPPLDATTDRPVRRRARSIVVSACAVGVALTVAAAVMLRPDGEAGNPAARPEAPSMSPPLEVTPPPVIPPPRPVPQDLADPAPTPQGFPLDREVGDEAAFPGNIRHRSGGPYLSEAQVRQVATGLAHCAPEPSPSTSRCDGLVVRYFPTYEQAFATYSPPYWSYYDGTIAHDREVYLVTVYGAIPYCNRAILRGGTCPIYRDHQNYVIDATTGQTPIGHQ